MFSVHKQATLIFLGRCYIRIGNATIRKANRLLYMYYIYNIKPQFNATFAAYQKVPLKWGSTLVCLVNLKDDGTRIGNARALLLEGKTHSARGLAKYFH